MKLNKSFLFGFIAVAGLASCVNEDIQNPADGIKGDKGAMTLDVSLLQPEATRARTEVADFPVIVYDADGNEVESYDAVEDVPASVVLSVGNYTVESHSLGKLRKRMSTPYYRGTSDMEIIKNVTTAVEVVCKMQNSPITVKYDSEFLSVFTDWTITLDDGDGDANTAFSFTKADGNNPAPVYWWFEGETKELTVQFRGTTQDGNQVAATNKLTKNQATERYDDDTDYFNGGNSLVLNFSVPDADEGDVTSVVINATVTFNETTEDLIVEVTDKASLNDDDEPETPPTPPSGDITLDLPSPISYPFLGGASVDKSLGDTKITATAGLKSIIVKIESTSPEMISSVGQLNTNYGVDFIGGAEIVGNQQVVKLFSDLNQPLSVPDEGDTEYVFPIGNFFGLLQVLIGEHTFHLTVTDMNGATQSGQVKITVTNP